MGFKPIDHRFGAMLFLFLLALGVIGLILAPSTEYHMAYIGSFIWVLAKFSYEKGKSDKRNEIFDYPKYLDTEWDNLAVNIVGIYMVVPQMHNIAGLQDEVDYSDLWYYGAGILTDLLYILVVQVAKLKKKYEGITPHIPGKDEEANNG